MVDESVVFILIFHNAITCNQFSFEQFFKLTDIIQLACMSKNPHTKSEFWTCMQTKKILWLALTAWKNIITGETPSDTKSLSIFSVFSREIFQISSTKSPNSEFSYHRTYIYLNLSFIERCNKQGEFWTPNDPSLSEGSTVLDS